MSIQPVERPLSARLGGILSTIRDKGLREATRLVRYRLNEEYHERRLGIRTTGLVTESVLGHQSGEFLSYSGAPYQALWRGLNMVSIRPGQDSFLDYGAGMGRAMICAATHPFKQVIGVEISATLAEHARQNFRRAAKHLRSELVLEVGDARKFPIPDEVTVIHLFNPFLGEVLATVGRNIRDSLHRTPRPLTIIFGNQGHFEKLFLHEGWLTRRFETRFYPGIGYAIYDCHPIPQFSR